ncbi:MAG: alkene reductase [Chthonomonadales bacterium]|nr:alkene reductase [Chthonomonadales bacterium]
MTAPNLFAPITLAGLTLPNRIAMAPMTRNRAGEGHIPTDLMATYYAQRASAGLIVTEATQVSPLSIAYPNTPGIHTPEQAAGWRKVTEAVHGAGGRIWLQLWHVGRIAHPTLMDGQQPVAPSAIAAKGEAFTGKGMEPFATPRALTTDEITEVVDQYVQGASYAKEAGFDGVEIHGANGYLIDQFLRTGSNQRTDEYGGSPENRARFLYEVTCAVTSVWGGGKVGVRLSPVNPFNDMSDSDPLTTFATAAQGLNDYGLAYLHISETLGNAGAPITPAIRKVFRHPLIVNGGYTRETANDAIASGAADLVAFGVPFISNPDLPQRLAANAPLNPSDRATFYGGGAEGYTDYPEL